MTNVSNLRPAIRKLVARSNLSEAEMSAALDLILSGGSSDASIASFLVALAVKGESVTELRAALDSMRVHARRITPHVPRTLIDTCGTGGDSIRSFNISTAAAILAASAGAVVAKHGNRSVSGLCGSADFMESIGFDLDTDPSKVQETIEAIGLGFLYAPTFHPAMRNVAAVRREIGIRTIFNMLGPLSNPCTNISGQVIGVYEPLMLEVFAEICSSYLQDAMVLHAQDGFDELSNTCANDVLLITQGRRQRLVLLPKSIGMKTAKPEELAVFTKEQAISDTLRVLNGQATQEKEDIVVLNASAALTVARISSDIKEGVDIARGALRSGAGRKKLGELIQRCGDSSKLEDAEKKYLDR
jgi:anthranilate phosphoribosyltransferase